MQNNLARYFQMSGYVLGVMAIIAAGVYALTHWSELRQTLYQTPGQQQETRPSGATMGDLDPHVGRILSASDEVVAALEMDAAGRIPLTEAQVRQGFRALGFAALMDGETLVSAGHVLATDAPLYFYNDRQGLLTISDVRLEPERDLGWARVIVTTAVTPLALAETLALDEPVYMWTNRSYQPVRTEGTVFDLKQTLDFQEVWGEVTVTAIPVVALLMENNIGDSGNPVFNAAGELVGVLVGVDTQDLALSYAARVTAE